MTQITFMIFVMFLCLFLFCLNFFLSEKEMFNLIKNTWFESGIENKISTRKSFSINFFIICIIFVMFDLELIFLFNYLIKMNNWYLNLWVSQMVFLFLFFFLTLLLEWKMNAISWKF